MSTDLDPSKLRKGDPATVAAYQAVLASRLRRRFHNKDLVESLVNTALLELLEKYDRGDRPVVPLYWALTAADNTARRKLTVTRREVVAYESGLHGSADQRAIVEAREELARLDELLTEVDETKTKILAAAAWGMSYREIAAEVGTTEGVVHTVLRELRAELRKQLSFQERFDTLRRLAREAGLSPELPGGRSSSSPPPT